MIVVYENIIIVYQIKFICLEFGILFIFILQVYFVILGKLYNLFYFNCELFKNEYYNFYLIFLMSFYGIKRDILFKMYVYFIKEQIIQFNYFFLWIIKVRLSKEKDWLCICCQFKIKFSLEFMFILFFIGIKRFYRNI